MSVLRNFTSDLILLLLCDTTVVRDAPGSVAGHDPGGANWLVSSANNIGTISVSLLLSFDRQLFTPSSTVFGHQDFVKAKTTFQKVAIDAIKNQPIAGLDWKKIYGVTLNLVKVLSETPIGAENSNSDTLKARAKLLKSPFKRKLERLKATAEKKDLQACDSAGVMLFAAFADAGEDVWKATEDKQRDWIDKRCDVFKYKEEVECDLTPSVSVVDKHATIMVGEIKTGIAQYKKAKEQMVYAAKILHLGLWIAVIEGKAFNSLVKKGY